jgi:hypothetical protein
MGIHQLAKYNAVSAADGSTGKHVLNHRTEKDQWAILSAASAKFSMVRRGECPVDRVTGDFCLKSSTVHVVLASKGLLYQVPTTIAVGTVFMG